MQADHLCVRSCGEPGWRCCDKERDGSRCRFPDLSCIPFDGVDGDDLPFDKACMPCGNRFEPICTEPDAPSKCNAPFYPDLSLIHI